jgi:hypothetical protein
MERKNTSRVSRQLVYARENGDLPWSWTVDETRAAETINQWGDLAAFGETVRRAYRRDRWPDQPRRVEVWSEKGTVRGLLAPVLDKYGVSFRVMHGFGSATEVNKVSEMTEDWEVPLLALYVGDHDPSGRHMSDMDLPNRLWRYYGEVELRRVALLPEQCTRLPSFAATEKIKDPRYKWFVQHHGHWCWELDAMSPILLRDLVEEEIRSVIDFEKWDHHEHIEQAEFESLDAFTKGLREAGAA